MPSVDTKPSRLLCCHCCPDEEATCPGKHPRRAQANGQVFLPWQECSPVLGLASPLKGALDKARQLQSLARRVRGGQPEARRDPIRPGSTEGPLRHAQATSCGLVPPQQIQISLLPIPPPCCNTFSLLTSVVLSIAAAPPTGPAHAVTPCLEQSVTNTPAPRTSSPHIVSDVVPWRPKHCAESSPSQHSSLTRGPSAAPGPAY